MTTAPNPARPLRALGLIVGLWVVGRSAFVWLDADVSPVVAATDLRKDRQPEFRDKIDKNDEARASRPPFVAGTARPVWLGQAETHRTGSGINTDAPASRTGSPVTRTAPSPGPAPGGGTEAAALTFPPTRGALSNAKARTDRSPWSGSFWFAVRDGSAAGLGSGGGQLGSSQTGVRLYRHLTPAFALTARASTALATRQSEASIGIAARRGAFALLAERRFALNSGGRNDWSLTAVAGVDAIALPLDFRLDGYAQAGIVGRDGFADGAVRIERTILSADKSRISIGAGSWGSVQPGLSRVDIGPQIVAQTRIGGQAVRISAEWRHRVAGNAAPKSGPVLTLGADF